MITVEDQRIQEVKKFLELDFNRSSEFQDIVELAAQLCDKPIALISLLDEESNWLKVRTGADVNVMPRETSFCKFAIEQDELLIIPDASKDSRFSDNPLVNLDPNLRFYAGAPLKLNNGLRLGTLCLFDQKPSILTGIQQKILPILARQVTFLMELEMSRMQLQQQVEQTEAKNESLMKIAQLQSHQIRQPLTSIMGLVNLIKGNLGAVDEEWLEMFEAATNNFDKTIYEVVAESIATKDLRAIRFNRMVEEIDDYAILLLDDKGTIEKWNRGAEKIKGYRSGDIIGKNFSIFYTDADKKSGLPNKLIKEAADFGVARDEGWRVRSDGTKFWGSIVITAIHNDMGDVIGFTKVTRDLTAVKDAQDAESFSIEMYNQLIEQTNNLAKVGGWELDLVNNKLSWTRITKEIHEVDESFVPDVETAINFYKEGKSRTQIAEAIKEAIENGTAWNLELEMITAKGKEITVYAIGRPNFRKGICTKVYGTFQDISASKKKRFNIFNARK